MKFLSILVLAGIAVVGTASAADGRTVRIGKHRAQANYVLAKFKDGTTPATRLNSLSTSRVRVEDTFQLVDNLVLLELEPLPAVNQAAPTTFDPPPAGKELLKRIDALMATGQFDFVEPDYLYQISLEPSDAAFQDGTLWGLSNTTTPGADVGAEAAWEITTGSTDVIVGVIDSGVRYTHQDLASQMWQNPGEIPNNGVDDDNDGYVDNVFGINSINNSGDPMDDNNHGTHVSGTIGAQANGGGPHVGVAWNVQIMALKFLNASGSGTTSDAIECVDFAVANGAKILNNSWGGGPYSQALFNSIRAAGEQGVLFVAAAGNDAIDNDVFFSYPASYSIDNIISVAALDKFDQLALFSSYGRRTVHLGAPGVGIYSSTTRGDDTYASFNGTSMATPHVAGVAALVWSHAPTASMSEIRQRLLTGAVPVDALLGITQTGGRVNALNSINASVDGNLELSISSNDGFRAIAGKDLPIFVRVTDLFDVNNATVTGTFSAGGNLSFVNDGTGDDQTANDSIYTTTVTAPGAGEDFTVDIHATATGKNPADASVRFVLDFPPLNDRFADAVEITSLPGFATGATTEATAEPNEPAHTYAGGYKSVWYKWRATSSGLVRASTAGSTFDTVLAAYIGYDGISLEQLGDVASNDDSGSRFTSEVLFNAIPGATFFFAVDGFFGDSGNYQFSIENNPPLSNDAFADRTPIAGENTVVQGFNIGASSQAGEPMHAGRNPFKSVWWEWNNADYSGPVTISTAGSSFDTIVAVYRGLIGGTMIDVASNIDAAQDYYHSEVTFNAVPSEIYKIAVDTATADLGSIVLSVATSPENDSFANARILAGRSTEDQGWNLGASGQSGEPDSENQKSVWWKWTAPSSGNATVNTEGSSFDTAIDVFTGTSVNNLSLVTFNDDRTQLVRTSLASFTAIEGTTYYFRVGGYFDFFVGYVDSGQINVSLSLDGASKLSLPELRSDGTVTIRMLGEPDRPYILSTSTDLFDWNPIATNSPVTQLFYFNHQRPETDTYYRANPVGLLNGPLPVGQFNP